MASQPFTWGSGGRRLTPDDIERERLIASRMMATDYSPIQSPWQGLARVSENVLGGLRMRGADRASSANADAEAQIMQALMGGAETMPTNNPVQPTMGGTLGELPEAAASSAAAPAGTPPASAGAINPAIIHALTSPYVSDNVRQLATMQYRQQLEAQNRRPYEPPEFVQMLEYGGYDPASQEGRDLVRRDIDRRLDPIVNIPLPGGQIYAGPRSGFEAAVRRAGGQAPPATLPPDFNFDEGGPSQPATGGF